METKSELVSKLQQDILLWQDNKPLSAASANKRTQVREEATMEPFHGGRNFK